METESNKLTNHMLRLAREDGESQPMYFHRRASVLRSLRAQAKVCVVDEWLRRLVSWYMHLYRHLEFPIARLLHTQTADWLEDRRASNHNRLDLWESLGFVTRWGEGWWWVVREELGLDWAMRRGDREQEDRRVAFLKALIFGSPLALEDEQVLAIEHS